MILSLPFLSVIFGEPNNFCNDSSIRNKILDYIGKEECLVIQPAFYKKIRKHLDTHYCAQCGEYMFSRFSSRKLIPHHHHFSKPCFSPIAIRRLKIHPKLRFVEWERYFPSVCSFPVHVNNARVPPRRMRIPAFHLWTIDEWNIMYPELYLNPDDPYHRLVETPRFLLDNPLFMP